MSDTLVRAKNLRKKYSDGYTAVEDSSFAVEEGEVLGIVGPNGAGKTTTLKMISGLIEPTEGTAEIDGIKSTKESMKSSLGFLPEESPVYDSMTATSYLKFFADLYKVPSSTAEQRIDERLSELDLDKRKTEIGDLSKGMTRKVLICRSLINDPKVLVYDEPASGLDPYTTNYIIEYIDRLSDDGKGIVFSAHNLYHVQSLCDRVIIMDDGDIVARGTTGEIRDRYGESSYDIVFEEEFPGSEYIDGMYKIRAQSMSDVNNIKQKANKLDFGIVDVYTVEPSLEDVFLDIIDT
jgi:ABC-2 type transport system ATP-binding protein